MSEAWAWFNRPLFSARTLTIFVLTAVLLSCGAASYNEGDNDDAPKANACADVDHRPEHCED